MKTQILEAILLVILITSFASYAYYAGFADGYIAMNPFMRFRYGLPVKGKVIYGPWPRSGKPEDQPA